MSKLSLAVVLIASLAAIAWITGVGAGMSLALSLYSRLASVGAGTVERDVAYGEGPRHRLDIYNPSGGEAKGPIVLFLYGGSWGSGDKAMYGFVGAALASRGLTTVIPDYRLYPEVRFPEFIDDAARAYAYVARSVPHAAERGIVVMGHSAGAHIAGLLAFDRSYLDRLATGAPRPLALVGLAGPYAFDPTTWPATKDIFATAPSGDAARPVAFAGPHAPPSLLMHGLADNTVKLYNMHELGAALAKAGVRVEQVELKGIGHFGIVLALGRGSRWRAPVLERVVEFIGSVANEAGRPD